MKINFVTLLLALSSSLFTLCHAQSLPRAGCDTLIDNQLPSNTQLKMSQLRHVLHILDSSYANNTTDTNKFIATRHYVLANKGVDSSILVNTPLIAIRSTNKVNLQMIQKYADSLWCNGGNTITTNAVFGTLNDSALRFITDNTPSGVIDPNNNNIVLGFSSGTLGVQNTGVGNYVLRFNTGSQCTAEGYLTLSGNQTSACCAFGFETCEANTNGAVSTAFGTQALRLNTTGNSNTAMGYNAMYNNLFIIRIVRFFEYLISIIIMGYLMWYFQRIRNWLKGQKEKNRIDLFTTLGIVSFIIIVGFLITLSLIAPLQISDFGPSWMPKISFVMKTRYFLILIFFIQIFFFLIIDDILRGAINRKFVLYFSGLLFGTAILFNMIHWSYTNYQYYSGDGANSFWHTGKCQLTMHSIIDSDAKNNLGENIVLTAFNWNLIKGPPFFSWSTNWTTEFDSVITTGLPHTKPVIIYTFMPDNPGEKEINFISKYNPKKVLECKEGVLYRIHLQ